MTTEEQATILGNLMLEKDAAKRELACARAKAAKIIERLSHVCEALDEKRRWDMDAKGALMFTELFDKKTLDGWQYPTEENIVNVLTSIRDQKAIVDDRTRRIAEIIPSC